MAIPHSLRLAIDQKLAGIPLRQLATAAAELTERYQGTISARTRHISSEIHRVAYLAVRLPATYAVAQAVLAEARHLMPDSSPSSLLDLGAGPGTIGWAATHEFESLTQITQIEADMELMETGKSLAACAPAELCNANWRIGDIRTFKEFPISDLICCSYALNEIPDARAIIDRAWQATRQALVIIEPGTVKGFELIRALRAELIRLGANILAPCPHQDPCPMEGSDWCHFSVRVERSALHRQIKAGRLGYEDEKYSYLIAARAPFPSAAARILRHPEKHAGFIRLDLCGKEERKTITVTRSDKENWKKARKKEWGDSWE